MRVKRRWIACFESYVDAACGGEQQGQTLQEMGSLHLPPTPASRVGSSEYASVSGPSRQITFQVPKRRSFDIRRMCSDGDVPYVSTASFGLLGEDEASEPVCMKSYSMGNFDPDPGLFGRVLLELELYAEREVNRIVQTRPAVTRLSSKEGGSRSLSRARISDLLKRLRMRELPSAREAFALVDQVGLLMESTCPLVRLENLADKLVVVGDLHGHFNDLLHLLDTFGEPSKSKLYLFNGDFVDRGDWGPEVLLTLFCYKLLYPELVHFNRGNHEDDFCNEFYGFRAQMTHAFPNDHERIYDRIVQCFDQMPLAHVVGGSVIILHGGLPLFDFTLEDIATIPKGPVRNDSNDKADRLREALLWSDPTYDNPRPSNRGAGALFSEDFTKRFLTANNLKCIVRSHECVPGGYRYDHGKRILTVFSASNYNRVRGGNDAAVAVIDAALKVTPTEVWNVPYVSAAWLNANSIPGGARGDHVGQCRSRESAESAWGRCMDVEEEDHRAWCALRSRAGYAVSMWETSARDRAFGELRRMIFLNRSRLLQAFEVADEERLGTVTLERWAEVMAVCFKTADSFPWREIAVHFLDTSAFDDVQYMDFLSRFQNSLSKLLSDRWCKALLASLAERHGDDPGREFDRVDTNGDGVLAFDELRPLFGHVAVATTSQEAARHDHHTFALFSALCRKRTGFVTRAEFINAILQARQEYLQCTSGHFLSELPLELFGGLFRKRHCNCCAVRVHRISSARRHCASCDYDVCEPCYASQIGLNPSDLCQIRSRRLVSLFGTTLETQFDRIAMALDVLCRRHVDIKAALTYGEDQVVKRSDFLKGIGRLLCGDEASTIELWDMMRVCTSRRGEKSDEEDETLLVADIERCFAIRDTASSFLMRSQ